MSSRTSFEYGIEAFRAINICRVVEGGPKVRSLKMSKKLRGDLRELVRNVARKCKGSKCQNQNLTGEIKKNYLCQIDLNI